MSEELNMSKKAILIILDGWGHREEKKYNAIAEAKTPNFDMLQKKYPNTLLEASANYVGLPDGQMGNSEVGHMNIGAGRIVYQDFTRINKAIEDGDLLHNETLLKMKETLEKTGGALHLMGLVSPGGVHSSMEHLYALLDFAAQNNIEDVFVHAFLDGRDTSPKSAREFIFELENEMEKDNYGKIASVMGRFWAMDRDNRWERVEKAYNALLLGEGLTASTAQEAVLNAYKNDETDEFVSPTVVIDDYTKKPIGKIEDGDAVLFFNFRSDRAREMSRAIMFDDFDGFKRKKRVKLGYYATMTQYQADFGFPVLFDPVSLKNILGEVVSKIGKKQLRIAETEKYAHVTFFLNGGKETVFEGEERILVNSPKVKTYDLKPSMSAVEVTDKLVEAIERYDLVILNYANADMVGHTGVFEAAVEAVETVDSCLGRVYEKIKKEDRLMIVTADHGNVELMYNEAKKSPHTAHTTNPVPFIVVNGSEKIELSQGILADIAPTMLKLLGIEIPLDMTGRVLF